MALAIELAFDLGTCLWGLANISNVDAWDAALAGALRGTGFLVAARYAIRGRAWGRIAIVVFDAFEAVRGIGMSFLTLAINAHAQDLGVPMFLFVLSVSAFFGASAAFVGIGLKPDVEKCVPAKTVSN